MFFHPIKVKGAYLVEPEKIEDNRGFFARSFCTQQFALHGLNTHFPEWSLSFNKHKGTLRGMHFQSPPHEEAKIVRCIRGTLFDVILDLRPDSETYKEWVGIELTQDRPFMLYIPPGCAHGFQTQRPNTEIFYYISKPYVPGYGSGVRWNDPTFNIQWPLKTKVISEKDKHYPDFSPS